MKRKKREGSFFASTLIRQTFDQILSLIRMANAAYIGSAEKALGPSLLGAGDEVVKKDIDAWIAKINSAGKDVTDLKVSKKVKNGMKKNRFFCENSLRTFEELVAEAEFGEPSFHFFLETWSN